MTIKDRKTKTLTVPDYKRLKGQDDQKEYVSRSGNTGGKPWHYWDS